MDDQLGLLFQDIFRELDIEVDNALSKIENNNKHKKEIIDTTSTIAEINSSSCLIYKVNRCLARYSPRATTTNRLTNRALNKPAWPGPY